ncbi:MAG: alpha/beta hydrolase [Chloroflexota bacterium]|nr:alpha/beta hydrolase [Chloroflexota bacterium]
MQRTEGTFSGCRNLELCHQCWVPDGEVKAVLLVAHGLAEHIGRYTNLVDYFVPRGYAVHGLDHCGHGRSEGLRVHVERFSDYVDDLKTFFDMVSDEHAGARIFLVGHSMGGTIATAYALRYQQELAGLMLSGATLKIGAGISSGQVLAARVLSAVSPKMGVSVLDASAISQDSAVVDAYVNDPLVYRGKIRARQAAEFLKTVQALPAQMSKLTLPILIMHGTSDRLSDSEGSQMLYDRAGSADKTLKLYEGFYHEIFNEPGREQVFADMEAWLAARL